MQKKEMDSHRKRQVYKGIRAVWLKYSAKYLL